MLCLTLLWYHLPYRIAPFFNIFCWILLLYLLSYFTVLRHRFLAPVFPQGGPTKLGVASGLQMGDAVPRSSSGLVSFRALHLSEAHPVYPGQFHVWYIWYMWPLWPLPVYPKGWMCVLTVFLFPCAYMWGWKDHAVVFFDFTLWREICVTQL